MEATAPATTPLSLPHETIPIAELDSNLHGLHDKSIKAIVTLIWPYSSSTQSTAILAVEPDYRLRSKKGQVRIQFKGHAAKAIAASGIGNGDTIRLGLQGARLADSAGPGTVQTPGRSVDVELVYKLKLFLQIHRNDQLLADIAVDQPRSPTPEATPARPPVHSSPILQQTPQKPPATPDVWSSPAFATPARLYNRSRPGLFDNFLTEEGLLDDSSRKRPRLWGASGAWHLEPKTAPASKHQPVAFGFSSQEDELESDLPLESKLPSAVERTTPVRRVEKNVVPDRPSQEEQLQEPEIPVASKGIVPTQESPTRVPRLPSLVTQHDAELPSSGALLTSTFNTPVSPHILPVQSATLPLVSPFPVTPGKSQQYPFEQAYDQNQQTPPAPLWPIEEAEIKVTPPNHVAGDDDLYSASPRLDKSSFQIQEDFGHVPDFVLEDFVRTYTTDDEPAVNSTRRAGTVGDKGNFQRERQLTTEHDLPTPIVILDDDDHGLEHSGVRTGGAGPADQDHIAMDSATPPSAASLYKSSRPHEQDYSSSWVERFANTAERTVASESDFEIQPELSPHVSDHAASNTVSESQLPASQLFDGSIDSILMPPTPEPSQALLDASPESDIGQQQTQADHVIRLPPTPLLTQEPSKTNIMETTEAVIRVARPDVTTTPSVPVSAAARLTSEVPDAISPWFMSRRTSQQSVSRQTSEAFTNDSLAKTSVDVPQIVAARNARHQPVSLHETGPKPVLESVVSHGNGFRTALSYYAPLTALSQYTNAPPSATGPPAIDVLATVASTSTKPDRAKAGPKDYFTTLYVVDADTFPRATQVQVFRPFSASLPRAAAGDVALLRNFTVKRGPKGRLFLLSAEASSWFVWHYGDAAAEKEKPVWAKDAAAPATPLEECRGPPVEIGEEERDRARHLAAWWTSVRADDGLKAMLNLPFQSTDKLFVPAGESVARSEVLVGGSTNRAV